MAKNTPILTHQGDKWANAFVDLVYPIVGLIIILAVNWGVPNKATLDRAEAYANRAKNLNDIVNIGHGLVDLGILLGVSFVAYWICALIFGTAHKRLFGEKTKVGLLWKILGTSAFLILVYLFTA